MSQEEFTDPADNNKFDFFSLGMGIFLIILAIGAGLATYFLTLNLVSKNTSFSAIPGLAVNVQDTPAPGATAGAPTMMAAIPEPATTPAPYDGSKRVNILLMGLDYRDWTAIQANEPSRTDSMILFTYDPISKSAGFMSIPRDMWVAIPGYDYAKINTAHFLGQLNNLPGGGDILAAKTVENFLGITVDYYAEIDFTAFTKFIDSIGCIDLKIQPEEDGLVIDPIGPGNTITLHKGTQEMCGAEALAYSRARHSAGDDFDRARRQQEVIMAIRSQVLNIYSLPKLIAIAPTLYNELSAGIKTNLPLDTAIQLAWAVKDVPKDTIKNEVIATNMVAYGSVIGPDGVRQDIIKPLPDKIRVMRDDLFADSGGMGPSQNNLTAAVIAEKAHINLQNDTTDASILTRTKTYLESLGMVVDISNATGGSVASLMNVYNAKPYAMTFLSQTMRIPTGQISNKMTPGTPNPSFDLQIIIGRDWVANNPMPK